MPDTAPDTTLGTTPLLPEPPPAETGSSRKAKQGKRLAFVGGAVLSAAVLGLVWTERERRKAFKELAAKIEIKPGKDGKKFDAMSFLKRAATILALPELEIKSVKWLLSDGVLTDDLGDKHRYEGKKAWLVTASSADGQATILVRADGSVELIHIKRA